MNTFKNRLTSYGQMLGVTVGTLALLAIALFCVFGFLASFEPGNGLAWKIGYGALGCICLTGAVALLRRPFPLAVTALTLFPIALIGVFQLNLPWLLGFGAIGYGCLIGTVALLRRPLASTLEGSALLAAVMFCVFGIVESNSFVAAQVGYAAVGCACLVGAVARLA